MIHPPTMTGEKKCKTCSEIKPVLHFSTHKGTRDGLQHVCRQCVSLKKYTRKNVKRRFLSSDDWPYNRAHREKMPSKLEEEK